MGGRLRVKKVFVGSLGISYVVLRRLVVLDLGILRLLIWQCWLSKCGGCMSVVGRSLLKLLRQDIILVMIFEVLKLVAIRVLVGGVYWGLAN